MKDLIANLYEYFFYRSEFQPVFDILYRGETISVYLWLFITAIVVPLIVMSIFYYVYKNPRAGKMTWFVWLLGAAFLVFGISMWFIWSTFYGTPGLNDNDLIEVINNIADPTTGYANFVEALLFKMPALNAVYALIAGFILSIFLKLFSKQFIHLPF